MYWNCINHQVHHKKRANGNQCTHQCISLPEPHFVSNINFQFLYSILTPSCKYNIQITLVCCNINSQKVMFRMTCCELMFHLFEYYALITIVYCSTFIIYDYNFSININCHEYFTLFVGQLYYIQHVVWKHLNKHYIFGKNILRCDNNILFNIWLSFKSQLKS